jgi:hypothetical protein
MRSFFFTHKIQYLVNLEAYKIDESSTKKISGHPNYP